jgi:hypothetical protein
MNPLRWSLEQQIALWLAVLSGGALGEVTGYFIYLSASGIQANSFGYWVLYSGLWWAVLGGASGAGVLYFVEKI